MQLSSLILASGGCGGWSVQAADATTPIDYTQRNAPFAPASGDTRAPKKQGPQKNEAVQDKRVEKTILEKQTAPLADRRSAIDVTETRDKAVREKDSRRPEVVEQSTSAFNHRPAAISTRDDTSKPPMVKKYQDRLATASTSNMARFPAIDHATGVKINRFVFRKNPAEPAVSTDAQSVTRAGAGPVVPK